MRCFFLLGSLVQLLPIHAAVPSDCTAENYLLTVPNAGGTRAIFHYHLYQAKWSVNENPDKDMGWEDLGWCELLPPYPTCASPYDNKAIYAAAGTLVSYNGNNYQNKWYANPGELPDSPNGAWTELHLCRQASAVPAPTEAPHVPASTTRGALIASSASTISQTSHTATTSTTTTTGTTTTSTISPSSDTTATTATTTTTTTSSPTTTTVGATTAYAVASSTTLSLVSSEASPGGDEQHRPTGPVGSNGECVWPAWNSNSAYPSNWPYYVTHKGGVYSLKYYSDPGREPGVDASWSTKITDCTGEPPATKWTEAELAAKVDPNGASYQVFYDRWDPTTPTRGEMAAERDAAVATLSESQKRQVSSLEVRDTATIESCAPGKDTNPENVKRVERLFPRSAWDQLFPVRHSSYTYENLLKAVGAFPSYCQTYEDGRDSDTICLKLLITSFAHNTQEVGANTPSLTYKGQTHLQDGVHYHPESDSYYKEGELIPQWRQALWFVREMGWEENSAAQSGYRACAPGGEANMWALNYQCPAGSDYFGRGSKQLSWNYNYGLFSKLLFGDADYLLSNPGLVADSWLNFASGIWFAVTPQSPKPSMLEVIDGSWQPNAADISNGIKPGFGASINIINGGLECNKPVSQQVQNRIDAYKNFAAYFNVPIPADEQVDCSTQKPFTQDGAGASVMYWGVDWSNKYKCKLQNYQSAFLVAVGSDYAACVDYWYRSRWVDRGSRSIVSQYGADGPTGKPPVV